MKIPIKHIFREFFHLINRLSFVEKIIYSLLSIALLRAAYFTILNISQQLINYLLENYQIIIAIFVGAFLFGLGLYLYISRVRFNQNRLNESSINDDENESWNIYNEGNYNENIHINGDYIEIHGDYRIDINNDFSEIAQEIRELINELKNQGYSEEDAKTEIANELAEEARKKPKVRKKLFMWKTSFGKNTAKTNDETEAASEVVSSATAYSYTSSKDFTEVVSGHYQKLDELLQARKWKEADLETAKIIYVISHNELPETSPYRTYLRNYFSSEYLKVLPRKDLNNINRLWLKYSNGRFGFSVQKCIWNRLGGGSDTTYNSEEIQEKFGDEVGWRKEGDWVYYSDIYYSLRAPSGHLPILFILNSDKSERCDIDFEILEVIVGRI